MKQSHKIVFFALFVIIILIGSLIYVIQGLKEESERNHLRNTELHLNSFKDQITQTIVTINRSIDNIGLVIEDQNLLARRIQNIISENPFITSITILDENNKVTNSSNIKNIDHHFSTEEYYPKPLFSSNVLRVGEVIKGRDLFEIDDVLTIVPFSKKLQINTKIYNVIIAISNNYFINKFLNSLDKETEELQIIRLDGKLLFSTNSNLQLNKNTVETKLYKQSLEKNFSSGMETINKKIFISAYSLTNRFPFNISIKIDYDKVMVNWEKKRNFAILFFSLLIIIIATIILKLFFKYRNAKNKEIRYQKQLIKNQEKLKNAYIVYENTNDGILITDKDANILDVNSAFLFNTEYTKKEVIGKNPNILRSTLTSDDFYEKMWQEIQEKNYWHGEIVNQNKNGINYNELLTINQILDDKGAVKNYIGVFTNITKEKEQALELKEKERFIFQQSKMAAMGEMLENIAHQWRQPLSVISTAATGTKMEKEFGLSDEKTEIERLTLINDSAQFLSQTIDDFRDFFKQGKEKETFFISEAIQKTLMIVQSKFKNRNIKIKKEIVDVEITEFKSELIQVLMNILNNARDVLENRENDERFVTIGVLPNTKNVNITIHDSGGGIPEKIRDKIFEPYFTTKHQSQGTGIGLYMSEEIITKHMKGTISVENKNYEIDGRSFNGALFTISIPL